MTNSYNYLKTITFQDSFTIDDIGNFILEGYNDDGEAYYLIIRTVLGISRILTYGPFTNGAITKCQCSFFQIQYDDKKINNIIKKFVNEHQDLTQIEIFDLSTKKDVLQFTEKMKNIVEFLYD